MKMFRYQGISDDCEVEFASQLIQSSYPPMIEPVRLEEGSASIGAAGQALEMVQPVIVSLEGTPGHFSTVPGRIHPDEESRDVCATRAKIRSPQR